MVHVRHLLCECEYEWQFADAEDVCNGLMASWPKDLLSDVPDWGLMLMEGLRDSLGSCRGSEESRFTECLRGRSRESPMLEPRRQKNKNKTVFF